MSFPWTLPDWLPWWALTLAIVPALIYLLLLLMMPFGVFGVKDRLAVIELRLDEIQAELRQLPQRLAEPEPLETERFAEPPRRAAAWQPEPEPEPEPPPSHPPRRAAERPDRAEPRLNWPR